MTLTEEVEYPDGDEALPPEAEDLIRRLLEKNPVERLGETGFLKPFLPLCWHRNV